MTFEREVRYVVMKITDIQDALTPDEKSALIQIEETVEPHREQLGKPLLVCARLAPLMVIRWSMSRVPVLTTWALRMRLP